MNKLKSIVRSALAHKFFKSETLNRPQQIAFCVAMPILILLAVFRTMPSFHHWDYNLSGYYLSYNLGFIRRGLIGSIADLFGFNAEVSYLIIFCFALLFAVIGITLLMYRTLLRLKPNSTGLWLFLVLTFTYCAFVPHFGYDIGRYDQFNFILMLVACFAIYKIRSLIIYPIVLSITIIMLLIHEPAFLMFIPLIFCWWLFIDDTRNLSLKVLTFIPLVALTFYIHKYGFITSMNYEEAAEYLRGVFGDNVVLYQLIYAFRTDPVGEVMEQLLVRKYAVYAVAFFMLISPLVVLLYRIISAYLEREREREREREILAFA
ncbi:MAG: hypothetical protein LBN32_03160 [Helicobacteraceae bacterium]|jgi:hypothetical protein|nr:hypothetical protein [Helicobacteraceae bacterium]